MENSQEIVGPEDDDGDIIDDFDDHWRQSTHLLDSTEGKNDDLQHNLSIINISDFS